MEKASPLIEYSESRNFFRFLNGEISSINETKWLFSGGQVRYTMF